MELLKSMLIAASGMRVQGKRMQVIAENVANADSMPQKPGDLPYQRKVTTFKNRLDRELGVRLVEVASIISDKADFKKRLDPAHPAADEDGYVASPNVNALVEMMDMREAQRTYEANLSMIQTAKKMLSATVDILR